MGTLRTIVDALLGLFVEDGLFALAILIWLLIAGAVSYLHLGNPSGDALVFAAGFLGILIGGVYRGARGR